MKRRVKQTVLRVLSRNAQARENDILLIWDVCREMGHELLPEQIELLSQLPNFASIIRARAKIQEQGRFRPPPDVWHERHLRQRKRRN